MTALRVLLLRALDWVLRRRRDRRLDDEIQTHLELLTEQYVAQGMPASDAALAARRAFGGVQEIKAAYREQRGLPMIDSILQDLRFAGRLLRRDRGFTVTAVLVLGLGLGINNMLFTILNAHTMRGLPMHRADRVVFISNFDDRVPDRPLSYADAGDLQRSAQSFAAAALFGSAPVIVAGDGRPPERVGGTFVSAGAFGLIGTQPVLGRDFSAEDARPGAAAVAILGSTLWESRYGADRGILGRSILVNGAPATIVGVMPRESGFPSTGELWLPLSQMPGLATEQRDARTLRLFARLRDGVAVSEAQAEVEGITARLAAQFPATNRNMRARAVPINERFLGRPTDTVWLAFMTTGIIVVLISCANVANLILARTGERAREIAIRVSLGAGRGRVVRQLLIEGAVLAALGGCLGFGVALAGVRVFRSAIPEDALPYWLDYSVDARVIAVLLAVSALTVLCFALLPALHTSRTDVNQVIKTGGRWGGGRSGRRWSSVVLAAEFALTVVMLAHLAVNVRDAGPDSPVDLTLNTPGVLTATLTLPSETYRTTADRAAFYRRLNDRLQGLAGITSVSAASALPLSGAEERRLIIAGRPQVEPAARPVVQTIMVGPRYFATLGLPVLRGREFVEEDGAPGRAHAIINEQLAEQFFGNSEALGEQLALVSEQQPGATPQWLTITGIAPTIRQRPRGGPDPLVYLPYAPAPPADGMLIVRSRTDTAALTALLRTELQTLDPQLPLYRVRTMAAVHREARWNGRVSYGLYLLLTFIAVALCTVGLYAVTSHGVSQATPEIGLRMALGARPHQVVGPIVRRVLTQVAIGFAAGIAGTRIWDHVLASGDPDLRATEPMSLLLVALALLVIAVLACIFPARRATRMDPVAAIGGR